MKGKMFKKTISCLLAVMMVVASVPVAGITASADDTSTMTKSISVAYRGEIQGDGNSRWNDSDKIINLVNDQCHNNFNVGYVTFDISSLPAVGDSVKYTIKVNQGSSNREPLGIATYYPTVNLTNFYKDGATTSSSSSNSDLFNNIFTGEKVDHIGRAKSYFGLVSMGDTIETHNDGKDYQHDIDISSAVKYAKENNMQYATLVFLSAKQGQYNQDGGWSDTSVYVDQDSATATYTVTGNSSISDTKIGVIHNGEGTRYKTDNGTYVIVANDQQNSNFTIGYFSFDISSFSASQQAVEAQYTFNEFLLSDQSEAMGLTYYYPTTNVDDFKHTNGAVDKRDVTSIYKSGNNSDYISSAVSYYGLVKMGSFTTSAAENVDRTIDISAAINAALNAGRKKAVVAFMLSAPGGEAAGKSDNALDSSSSNNNYWSDTMLKLTNTSLTVKMQDIPKVTYTSPSNVNTDIKSKIDKGAYTGDASRAADGSYTKSALTGDDEMSNVLWTYGVSGSSAYKEKGDRNYYNAGIQFGAITFLYDGTNKMACPINFSVRRTGIINYNQKPHSMYAASTNYIQLNHKWHGTSSNCTYQTSTTYSVNTVNAHQVSTPKSNDLPGTSYANYYSNTMYMKTGYLSFSSNLMTIPNTDWHIYVADDNKSETSGFDASFNTSGNANGDMAIRIINYKPIKDAMVEIQSFYKNNVYQQENYYTDASLSDYYDAISKVCIDPNSYFDTSSTSGNNYTACQNAVTTAINAIDTAKGKYLKKRTVDVTYNFEDGTQTVLQFSAGVTPTDLAHNASATYSNITETTHTAKVYGWDNLSEKLLNDTTINETSSVLDSVYHDFNGKTECECGSTIDLSTYTSEKYNAANLYAQGETSGYSVDSISNYYDAVKELVKDNDSARNNVHCQAELDEIVVQMLYARSLLKKQLSTVNLVVYDSEENEITADGQSYTDLARGDTITVEPKTKHNVVKWVVESNGSTYQTVGERSSLELAVTGDVTVRAYCDDSASDTSVAYTKVIFKGSNGKIVNIKYVKAGETLDTSKVEKPSIPMYTTGDWNVQSVVGSADQKVVTVVASCEPDSTNTCGVHFPGMTEPVRLPYNTRVDIKDYLKDSNDSNIDYALASDEARSNIIAYLDGTVFYVPARSDVYVTKKEKGSKTTMVNTVGVYSTLIDGKKKIGFNNKFTLADGCQKVEWGIVYIVINKDGSLGTSTVMTSKALSAEKEYTSILSLKETNDKYKGVRAKAYLKYIDEDNVEQVIYGDEYTQSFTTNTTIGGTKL